MAVQVSYPGVYIEEIPSSPTTVTSATTSATAFADFFLRGPMGEAVMVTNFADFQRTFGGLSPKSEASYAISQYFVNGGQTAWVVRLGDGSAKPAQIAGGVPVSVPTFDSLLLEAQNAAATAKAAADQANKLLQSDLAKESTEGTAADAQAAIDVATQTSLAAEATRQAAAAARVAGLELQEDIEAATPDVAARDAAINAALAADKAQQAAQQAATAVANAKAADGSLHSTPTPTAPAAAQTAAGAGITSTVTASTTLNTDLGKVTTDGNTAATAASGGAASTKKALNTVNSQAAQAISAGTALSSAATATQTAFNSLTTNGSVTVTTAPEIQNLSAQVTSLAQLAAAAVTAAEGLVAASVAAQAAAAKDDKVTDKSSFATLVTDSQSALNDALAASLGASQAAAAMGPWINAANESQNETDTAVSAAAGTAANDANTTYQAVLALQNAATAYNSNPANAQKQLVAGVTTAITSAVTAAQTALTSTQAVVSAGASAANTQQATTDTKSALTAITAVWTAAITAGSNANSDLLNQIIVTVAAGQTAALDANITQDLFGTTSVLDSANQAVLDAMTAAAAAAGAAATAALQAALAMQEGQAAVGTGQNILYVQASNPGAWGNAVQVAITVQPGYRFDLSAQEMAVRNGQLKAVSTETFRNLTLGSENDANFAPKVVESSSKLIRLRYSGLTVDGACPQPASAKAVALGGGTNGNPPRANDLFPTLNDAINNIAPNVINLLCLPIVANYSATEASTAIANAQSLVAAQHAFFIVDIPASVDTTAKMQTWMQSYGNAAAYNCSVYFPRLMMPDPLQNYRLKNVGVSGTLAGIYSRTDLDYGVWETPAGINAVIENAQIAGKLTDVDNGTLNSLGVNCLRTFPVYGNVVWGGRTMAGADQIGSQWKYINVRRLADYIEQSLLASLRWAVFQNNDPRLWSQIRAQVGSFMSGLFAAGAFAGGSADQAYLVKCDATTTTQTDIDNGIVNILVGFAPEKPAEFVVISIEQLAGQTAS